MQQPTDRDNEARLIDQIYQGLFHRSANPWEIEAWLREPRMSIPEMIRDMSHGEEHLAKLFDQAGDLAIKKNYHNEIEFCASEAQIHELLNRQLASWNLLGETQPYFSVLTNPIFLAEAMNSDRILEFYNHGRLDVEFLYKLSNRFGIWLPQDGIVLEYGCGLGRLARHFCEYDITYIGVDASESHLRIARRHIEQSGYRNALFFNVAEYEQTIQDNSVDFLVSLLVFQHTPPPLMMRQIETFLRKLRPGGGAYLQVPTYIFKYSFSIEEYFGNPPPVGQIEMHATTKEQVFRAISKCGHTLVDVVSDGRIGDMGISSGFVIRGGT